MSATQHLKQSLFQFFEARGVVAGHVIRIADFIADTANRYTPAERAEVDAAFAELVASGVFQSQPRGEYILTAKGLDLLRDERTHLPA
jgi:hypothetical protein